MKQINIADILKDYPKGTLLYSPVCGELLLAEVTPNGIFCKQRNNIDDNKNLVFMEDGHFKNYGQWNDLGECLIFPSKDMRNWSKLQWKKGDILISEDGNMRVMFDGWVGDDYTEFNTTYNICGDGTLGREEVCLTRLFSKADSPTTNRTLRDIDFYFHGIPNLKTYGVEKEEKQKLVLQPFDLVLCRDKNENTWVADIYGYYDERYFLAPYRCVGRAYEQCIPYNDQTKHLLGTAEDWEGGNND